MTARNRNRSRECWPRKMGLVFAAVVVGLSGARVDAQEPGTAVNRQVRLNKGDQGRLEILDGGVWSTVTRFGFTDDHANLVCQHMGFQRGGVMPLTFPLANSNSMVINKFGSFASCGVSNPVLDACALSRAPSTVLHQHDVQLRCFSTFKSPAELEQDFRFHVDGATVLVKVPGTDEWGTVARPGIDRREANAMCKILKPSKPFGEVVPARRLVTAQPFALVNMVCNTGNCDITAGTTPATEPGVENLDLAQRIQGFPDNAAVAVRCRSSRLDVKVKSNSRVLVEKNTVMGTIDGDGLFDFEASLICQQVGANFKRGIKVAPPSGGAARESKTPVQMRNIHCPEDATSILECSYTDGLKGVGYSHAASDMHVRCLTSEAPVIPVLGRYFSYSIYDAARKEFGVIDTRGFGEAEATVACKMILNDPNFSQGRVFSSDEEVLVQEKIGEPLLYSLVTCTGLESSLHECDTVSPPNKQTLPTFSTKKYFTCNTGPSVDVRIAGASSRVEAHDGDEWIPVCGSTFTTDIDKAQLICNADEVINPSGNPNDANRPEIIRGLAPLAEVTEWGVLDCPEDASSVIACQLSKTTTCAEPDTGLSCSEQELTSRVRIDTNDDNHVEVHINNEWSRVCARFSDDELFNLPSVDFDHLANVVCRELDPANLRGEVSFSDDEDTAQSAGQTSFVDGISCEGDETSIDECLAKSPLLRGSRLQSSSVTCLSSVKIECFQDAVPQVPVRVTDGNRLEVFKDGLWGTVCDDGSFNDKAAAVACAQLGYVTGSRVSAQFTNDPPLLRRMFMAKVVCKGNEDGLESCKHQSDAAMFGVKCKAPQVAGQSEPTEEDLKYAGGKAVGIACSSDARNGGPEGELSIGLDKQRLHITVNGKFGTICDNKKAFSDVEATVACRELGYDAGVPIPRAIVKPYVGKDPIVMSNVECFGSESSLFDCSFKAGKVRGCKHGKDVAVKCYNNPTLSDDVRFGSDGKRIELYRDDMWVPILPIDSYAANMLCRAMGKLRGTALRPAAVDQNVELPDGVNPVRLQCPSTAEDLSNCAESRTDTCEDVERFGGVLCHDTLFPSQFARFARNEKRVLVWNDGAWGSVYRAPNLGAKGFTKREARVACRMMGFKGARLVPYDAKHLPVVRSEQSGDACGIQMINPVEFFGTVCRGREQTLHQCPSLTDPAAIKKKKQLREWQNGLDVLEGEPQVFDDIVEDYRPQFLAVDCFNSRSSLLAAPEQVARISSGDGFRLELFNRRNGGWGTVCAQEVTDFDQAAATVACRMMGAKVGIPVYDWTWKLKFLEEQDRISRVSTRPRFTNVKCTGNELSLFDCSMDVAKGECRNNLFDVGVVCIPDDIVDNFAVHISEETGSEGMVTVTVDGQTGRLCPGNVNAHAFADVVCKARGFVNGRAFRGPIVDDAMSYWSAEVSCNAKTSNNPITCFDILGPGLTLTETCPDPYDLYIECLDDPIVEPSEKVRLGLIDEATVEVFVNGAWSNVCDSFGSFSNTEAQVVCRELGLTGGNVLSRDSLTSWDGRRGFSIDAVSCQGNEANILKCEAAPAAACTSGAVRVQCDESEVGQITPGPKTYQVKDLFSGRFLSVCADRFDFLEGDVACKGTFGPDYYASMVGTKVFSASEDPPVVLKNVACTGAETSIWACKWERFEVDDICEKVVTLECSNEGREVPTADLKLLSDRTVLAQSRGSAFRPICVSGIKAAATNLMCEFNDPSQRSGHYSSISLANSRASQSTDFWTVDCPGTATAFEECDLILTNKCLDDQILSLQCRPKVLAANSRFQVGAKSVLLLLRPVANKPSKQALGTVCENGFDHVDIALACRDMGRISGFKLPTQKGGFRVHNDKRVYFNGISPVCTGFEQSPMGCALTETQRCNKHNGDTRVTCLRNQPAIRLASSVRGGRLEIYHNLDEQVTPTPAPTSLDVYSPVIVDGALFQSDKIIRVGQAVCRSMGFSRVREVDLEELGDSDDVTTGIHTFLKDCTGVETDLLDCAHEIINVALFSPGFPVSQYRAINVKCSTDEVDPSSAVAQQQGEDDDADSVDGWGGVEVWPRGRVRNGDCNNWASDPQIRSCEVTGTEYLDAQWECVCEEFVNGECHKFRGRSSCAQMGRDCMYYKTGENDEHTCIASFEQIGCSERYNERILEDIRTFGDTYSGPPVLRFSRNRGRNEASQFGSEGTNDAAYDEEVSAYQYYGDELRPSPGDGDEREVDVPSEACGYFGDCSVTLPDITGTDTYVCPSPCAMHILQTNCVCSQVTKSGECVTLHTPETCPTNKGCAYIAGGCVVDPSNFEFASTCAVYDIEAIENVDLILNGTDTRQSCNSLGLHTTWVGPSTLVGVCTITQPLVDPEGGL
ncbi:Scavenger receptor cysteine-rich type 1 protein M160 (CD163 antigen-like 1) (CD antigen CD163b) [Durusdinium trenchii]|uniref:Scavenger receptor cysteine-rich type 1 protein M160 (CD163 antigen-like 1) (CD antigen CD163b) n=1 Tax=Durusdinium trenchii TaxID=1381693 RepID=A0ABP0I8H3_9DINO